MIILDGCTFVYSDAAGDVEAQEAEGFFYENVRHLSSWHLLVDGEHVEPLTSRRVDYYSARVLYAAKPQAWAAAAPLLALRTLLGLEAVDGKLRSRPAVPERFRPLALRNVRVHGRAFATRR